MSVRCGWLLGEAHCVETVKAHRPPLFVQPRACVAMVSTPLSVDCQQRQNLSTGTDDIGSYEGEGHRMKEAPVRTLFAAGIALLALGGCYPEGPPPKASTPADFPVYPGATPTSETYGSITPLPDGSRDRRERYDVTWISDDDGGKLFAYYKTQLAQGDWVEQSATARLARRRADRLQPPERSQIWRNDLSRQGQDPRDHGPGLPVRGADLGELRVQAGDRGRRQARRFEVRPHPTPSPLDMVQRVEHPLRRAPELLPHRLQAPGRGLREPLLVTVRELEVGLGVVGADSFRVDAGERKHHRRDHAGPVLAGETVKQHRSVRLGDGVEDCAESSLPALDHQDVALGHPRRFVQDRSGGVVDEREMSVGGSLAISPSPRPSPLRGEGGIALELRERRAGRALDLRLAAEIDHSCDAVIDHRLPPLRGQARDVVRADDDAASGESPTRGKPTEVARVPAVRPIEPAHDSPRRYRFVYWGAFRARFSPYFLRSEEHTSELQSHVNLV